MKIRNEERTVRMLMTNAEKRVMTSPLTSRGSFPAASLAYGLILKMLEKVVRIPIVPTWMASRRTNPSGTNEAIAGWSGDTKFPLLLVEMNLTSATTMTRVEVAMEANWSCLTLLASRSRAVVRAGHPRQIPGVPKTNRGAPMRPSKKKSLESCFKRSSFLLTN